MDALNLLDIFGKSLIIEAPIGIALGIAVGIFVKKMIEEFTPDWRNGSL